MVRGNGAWGLIHFAHNYSEALVRRIEEFRDASEEVVEDAMVNVRLDMSSE